MDRRPPGQGPFRDPWQSRVLGRPRLDCLWGHGHDFPVYNDGLVLTRTWILPRHRKTHSLQLSPVVSGATAPVPALYGHDFPVYNGGLVLTRTWILNSELVVVSSNAVCAASPQNSLAYLKKGRSCRARRQNVRRLPCRGRKRETKTLKNKKINSFLGLVFCHKSLGAISKKRGARSNIGKHGAQVRWTIPDIRHGENQGLRILGTNQTQLGRIIINEHNWNGKQEKPNPSSWNCV